MLSELHDYLYRLQPQGGIPLKGTGIVLGLLLVAAHLWAWRQAGAAKAFLKELPRSYAWGVALMTIDFVWAMMILMNMDMGEFHFLRRPFLTVVPLGYVGMLLYVKEFLAVRALGGLLLLAAGPVLAAAFLQPPVTRLLLPLLAYVWIFVGMFLVGMPFLLRDWVSWAVAKESRWKACVWGGIIYGALMAVLAVTTY
ncbi:MAG TPA: hypothetical protein VD994_18620 [Prosthecobacter sp.]|nr:hypothetical protein [Prosthecobacter sp.]